MDIQQRIKELRALLKETAALLDKSDISFLRKWVVDVRPGSVRKVMMETWISTSLLASDKARLNDVLKRSDQETRSVTVLMVCWYYTAELQLLEAIGEAVWTPERSYICGADVYWMLVDKPFPNWPFGGKNPFFESRY